MCGISSSRLHGSISIDTKEACTQSHPSIYYRYLPGDCHQDNSPNTYFGTVNTTSADNIQVYIGIYWNELRLYTRIVS